VADRKNTTKKKCAHEWNSLRWSLKGLCCRGCNTFFSGDVAVHKIFEAAKSEIFMLSSEISGLSSAVESLGLVRCDNCEEWSNKKISFYWTPTIIWCPDCVPDMLSDNWENCGDFLPSDKKRIVHWFHKNRTMLESIGKAKWFSDHFLDNLAKGSI
jgi:hypothetical protein